MKPKVIEISKTLFEIPELKHSVKIQTKQGRTLLICSCTNDTKFCNESPFCYHKQIVTQYLALKPINEKLDKLINTYSGFANIKAKFDAEVFLGELKKLKRLIEGKHV